MRTVYLLQIVSVEDGTVAQLPAGGALEADLTEIIVAAVRRRPIGLFRTGAQVETAVRDGIQDAMRAIKAQSRFTVPRP